MLRVVDGCASAIALQQLQAVLQLRQPELELVHLAPRDQAELACELLDAEPGALPHSYSIAAPPAGKLVEPGARLVGAHAVEEGQEELLDRAAVIGLVHADAFGAAAGGAGGVLRPWRGRPPEPSGRARARAPPLLLPPRPARGPPPPRPR